MLTPLQKKKLVHYFNVLDFDKSGTLEKADFLNIGENLSILWGFKEGTPEYETSIDRCRGTWAGFRNFIGKSDESHATIEEWIQFADQVVVNGDEELYEKHVNKVMREIFNLFDLDGDGYISLNEYIDLFMAYRIEIRYSARAFTKLDLNQDDLISRDELLSGIKEFFRSDDREAAGNWLFGFWETYLKED